MFALEQAHTSSNHEAAPINQNPFSKFFCTTKLNISPELGANHLSFSNTRGGTENVTPDTTKLVVGELPLLAEDQASVHTQAQKFMQNLNLPSYYSFYKLLLV